MSGEVPRRVGASVDHDVCVGHGGCRRVAPTAFRRTALGQSEFVEAHEEPDAGILEAAANCPVAAITVRVEESGAPRNQ
jgi:ferredoxin